MPKGKNHDVICPGCRESYHETTKRYNPNRDANAGMLKLKDIYISYGWDQPPPDPTAGYGFLECPNCSAPLAPSGRLEVREREVRLVSKEATIGDPESISIGTEAPIDKTPSTPFSVESVIKDAQDKERELPPGQLPIEELDKNYPDMTGEGKWICPHCGRGFKKKAHLGSHMRVYKKGK